MANVKVAQNLAQNYDSNWPKLTKFLAGGVNGRVYETNDGRLMKFVYDNAPQEFRALEKLQGTFIVPRYKKGNGGVLHVTNNESKEVAKVMFPKANYKSDKVTIFIMGRAGGSQGMTLRQYLEENPNANRANIQRRVEYIISEMHVRGVSHGNLHDKNIIVTVGPTGRISGMWAIDFGRAFYHKAGKTERNTFWNVLKNNVGPPRTFATSSAFSRRKKLVPVSDRGSRSNRSMMNVVYGKRILPSQGRKIATRRSQVASIMKNYKSPTSRPKAKSLSLTRGSPKKTLGPRSAPARVSSVRKTPLISRSASLKRKRNA